MRKSQLALAGLNRTRTANATASFFRVRRAFRSYPSCASTSLWFSTSPNSSFPTDYSHVPRIHFFLHPVCSPPPGHSAHSEGRATESSPVHLLPSVPEKTPGRFHEISFHFVKKAPPFRIFRQISLSNFVKKSVPFTFHPSNFSPHSCLPPLSHISPLRFGW